MSGAIEQIATGALVKAAGDAIGGDWASGLAVRGASFIEGLSDPAIKAGLSAALGTLTTPEAIDTLKKAAQHEVTAFAIRLNLGQTGEARAIFIAESDFAARHALIASDRQALVQATDERIAFVSSLESLLVSAGSKAGAALVPFLLALL